MQSRLDLLDNLYHSNARQIDQLVRANTEITREIVNIVNREQNVSREQLRHRTSLIESDVRDATVNRILESFLAPIDIYPTQNQLESATRTAVYGEITRPPNTTCPISLDAFDNDQIVTVIRHCGHIFSTEQIVSWFRANCRCPVCRYDIRNYQHVLDVSANAPLNDNGDISTNEEEQ